MFLRLPFKVRPVLLCFGMLCREYKLFSGLIRFFYAILEPCLEMRSGSLTVYLLLPYCWIDEWMPCLLFLVWIYCVTG